MVDVFSEKDSPQHQKRMKRMETYGDDINNQKKNPSKNMKIDDDNNNHSRT